jgi:hypothetical protein
VEAKCGAEDVEDVKGLSVKGIFSPADQTFVQGIFVTSLLDLGCFTPKNGVLSATRVLKAAWVLNDNESSSRELYGNMVPAIKNKCQNFIRVISNINPQGWGGWGIKDARWK